MTGRRKAARSRRMVYTRQRLSDDEARARLTNKLKSAYEAGASIRELAAEQHLAFGTVRTLLLEAGVALRSRGGPNHIRLEPDEQNNTSTKKES